MELTEQERETALIAKFMGQSVQFNLGEHPETGEYIPLDEFKYKSSWDWLMLVAQKVDEIIANEDLDEWISELYIAMSTINISIVYNTLVEFIKWYNNQDK